MTEPTKKRKQPPTFQHYAPQQARKLKKAWIQKTQIKSKWKAERRRLQAEGLLQPLRPWGVENSLEEDGREDSAAQTEAEDETSLASEADSEPAPPSKRQKRLSPPPHIRPSSSSDRPHPSTRHRTEKPNASSSQQRTKPSWKDEIANTQDEPTHPKADLKGKGRVDPSTNSTNNTEEPERPKSLRDLKKEAFSKTNLHTHKADPLHKHGYRARGGPNARGRGGSGGGRGHGGPRGQPNMKLRMNYMLEKIKREYGPVPS